MRAWNELSFPAREKAAQVGGFFFLPIIRIPSPTAKHANFV
jgi:hypothetical protein